MNGTEMVARAKARLGGVWGFECWRPYDPVEAKRVREKFSNLPWYRRLGRWLIGKKNGVDSPEYKAIPRYLVWADQTHNICTDEGLNHILGVEFSDDTQLTDWYCLIFESDTTPAAGTTYATPVFTESTAYDEATRPAWEEGGVSSKSITNSANKATFTMSDTKTIYGAALVAGGTDADTKGDTEGGGTLFCASKLGASRPVVDDDVLNLTYTLSAADDA